MTRFGSNVTGEPGGCPAFPDGSSSFARFRDRCVLSGPHDEHETAMGERFTVKPRRWTTIRMGSYIDNLRRRR